jgi:hypothetical protein
MLWIAFQSACWPYSGKRTQSKRRLYGTLAGHRLEAQQFAESVGEASEALIRRILREFDASLAEPKEIQDHADLKIFLQGAAVSETWRVRRRWTRLSPADSLGSREAAARIGEVIKKITFCNQSPKADKASACFYPCPPKVHVSH